MARRGTMYERALLISALALAPALPALAGDQAAGPEATQSPPAVVEGARSQGGVTTVHGASTTATRAGDVLADPNKTTDTAKTAATPSVDAEPSLAGDTAKAQQPAAASTLTTTGSLPKPTMPAAQPKPDTSPATVSAPTATEASVPTAAAAQSSSGSNGEAKSTTDDAAPKAARNADAKTGAGAASGQATADGDRDVAGDVADDAAAAAAETQTPAAASANADAATAATAEPAQGTAGPTETTVLEPTPGASGPDPLTPAQADTSPAIAPGAPTVPSAASPPAIAVADPLLEVVRARLAAKAAPANAGAASDLSALKAFYAKADAKLLWVKGSDLSDQGKKLLDALRRADSYGLDSSVFSNLMSSGSTGPEYEGADREIEMALAALKYARHARGGRVNPPSLSAMIDVRPRLYEPGSLLTALAIAPAADVYLEGLHPRHAGFIALKDALAKVRAEKDQSAETKSKGGVGAVERRLLVNMERWRWLPDTLGNFYVWDNVPEQLTRVYHDDKKVLEERIVVGKPKTPTPMFSAPMKFVIFQPSWGVPDGIKTNELGPMLRRAQARQSGGWFFNENDGATRALRRHELKVFRGGREINPDSVDWARVDIRQFHFTQPPSAKNVLGVVKFRFPNKFDVYMHDTADRHLFSRSPRTFSHGCMRVQNPLRLAETILAYDKGWSRGHVQSLAARSGTTSVTLDKTVPVHIVYFTATVDTAGKLHSHADIYGMDSRVASALAGRSVTLTSAKPVVEEASTGGERPRRRQRRAEPERSPSPAAARPFNPFAASRNSGG
ncbi:MAG: L,D-transpeptidase family protein [Hyphomicrobiaceae bacterium]